MSGLMTTQIREIRICSVMALLCICLAALPGFGQAGKKKSAAKPRAAAAPAPAAPAPEAQAAEAHAVQAPQKLRIGIAPAEAQVSQTGNGQTDYGAPIRDAIVAMMSGPAVDVVALSSRIPVQLQAEAAQQQCDYILLSSITVKHNSGGFGRFMKSAGIVTNAMPMVALTKMAANKAAAAAMTAQQQAASELAVFEGQIKAKDDITMDYHLIPAGQGKPKLEESLKSKAKSDKEDVLTPLMQQMSNTILTEVTKK